MDALRSAVRELISSPSASGADAVNEQLRLTPASDELARFICETLEATALHEVRDSAGVSLRWRLIDRLLGLGFPHALHVAPDDLDYHRNRHGRGGSTAATLTSVVAVLSMLWSFLLGVAFNREWQIAAPLFTLSVFSLFAFVSAVRVSRGEPSALIGKLGACAGLYPVGGVVVASVFDQTTAFIGLFLAAPALVTALLCLVTAAVQPKEPAPLAAPELQVPLPAAGGVVVERDGRVR